MEQDKIRYRNLSTPLKIIIILSWVFAIVNILYFIAGFVGGLLGL